MDGPIHLMDDITFPRRMLQNDNEAAPVQGKSSGMDQIAADQKKTRYVLPVRD